MQGCIPKVPEVGLALKEKKQRQMIIFPLLDPNQFKNLTIEFGPSILASLVPYPKKKQEAKENFELTHCHY